MHSADDFITFPHATPEQRLIAAILHRAVLDLFGKVNLVATPEEGRKVKYDALKLLTAASGAWAQRREDLCDAIGLNSDLVRAKIIDILEDRARTQLALSQREDAVEVAREMWRDEEKVARRTTEAREAQRKIVIQRRLNAEAVASRPKTKAPPKTLDDQILDAIRSGHTTIRTINFCLDGDIPNDKIRKVLMAAKDAGRIIKQGPDWLLVNECEAA